MAIKTASLTRNVCFEILQIQSLSKQANNMKKNTASHESRRSPPSNSRKPPHIFRYTKIKPNMQNFRQKSFVWIKLKKCSSRWKQKSIRPIFHPVEKKDFIPQKKRDFIPWKSSNRLRNINTQNSSKRSRTRGRVNNPISSTHTVDTQINVSCIQKSFSVCVGLFLCVWVFFRVCGSFSVCMGRLDIWATLEKFLTEKRWKAVHGNTWKLRTHWSPLNKASTSLNSPGRGNMIKHVDVRISSEDQPRALGRTSVMKIETWPFFNFKWSFKIVVFIVRVFARSQQ